MLKRVFWLSCLFLVTLVASLLTHLPLSFVLGYAPVPSALRWDEAQGTLWQAKLTNVRWQQWSLGEVETEMQWSSLFKGRVELALRAGRGSEVNYSLKGFAGVSFDGIYARDVFASVPATTVAQQLVLPIPVDAAGRIDMTIRDYQFEAPYCRTATGALAWTDASFSTPFAALELGQVIADVDCQDQQLQLSGEQISTQVEAQFNVDLDERQQYSLEAQFTPLDEFPQTLRGQLSWLGTPNSDGYYQFNYSGRL